MLCKQASSRVKTVSESSEDLAVPSPPAVLPPDQQQEYMQLQRLLALHQKKKQRDQKEQARSQKAAAPVRKLAAPDSAALPENPPLPITNASQTQIVAKSVDKIADARPPVSSLSKLSELEQERVKKHAEAEKRMEELTKKRKAVKESEDWEQQRVTALTHQLADCVSEIAEHEQNMEKMQSQLVALQKQLEVSKCSV